MLKKLLRLISPVLELIYRFFFLRKYSNKYIFEKELVAHIWFLKSIWVRNILRVDTAYPFPVALGVKIANPENLVFEPEDLHNFQSHGCYYQNYRGTIVIGKGSYIAPNCGFITANHDATDISKGAQAKDIVLGEKCWIGMNCVILPGVELGGNTLVGAGSVVTKSFPEGNVVVAGSPAKVIRKLDRPIN